MGYFYSLPPEVFNFLVGHRWPRLSDEGVCVFFIAAIRTKVARKKMADNVLLFVSDVMKCRMGVNWIFPYCRFQLLRIFIWCIRKKYKILLFLRVVYYIGWDRICRANRFFFNSFFLIFFLNTNLSNIKYRRIRIIF